jgi:cystathionine gamma-synthase
MKRDPREPAGARPDRELHDKLRPSTLAVVAGSGDRSPGDPIHAPVAFSSIFLPSEDGAEYGRITNPTWDAFETALGALEGGDAVAFSSGLAASSAILGLLPARPTVVAPFDCYHGFRLLLRDLESTGRLRARLLDIGDTDRVLAACMGADLLWIESPTNPLMAVADVPTLANGAREMGALVTVDNTVATPLLQRPLALGADLSVHSVTKLLGGHSDLIMGAAVASDPSRAESLRTRRALEGAIPGPMETFLALRGLRTLDVRLERARASAAELAARLTAHPAVSTVRYPREPDGEHGLGTLIAFEPTGGKVAAERLCRSTRLIVHATSFGGVETLIDRRARWPLEERTPPGLLRLSVGCEHVEDLWSDLEQALALASRTTAPADH